MVIYLDLLLPASSSDPPENRSGRSIVFISVLLRMRFTYALPVTSQAVSSYLTISPLPLTWRYISVALSLESPLPDVIRHPALRSPDFPRLNPFVCSAAITWPGCASAILARFFALVKKFHSTILHIKAASTDKFS